MGNWKETLAFIGGIALILLVLIGSISYNMAQDRAFKVGMAKAGLEECTTNGTSQIIWRKECK